MVCESLSLFHLLSGALTQTKDERKNLQEILKTLNDLKYNMSHSSLEISAKVFYSKKIKSFMYIIYYDVILSVYVCFMHFCALMNMNHKIILDKRRYIYHFLRMSSVLI